MCCHSTCHNVPVFSLPLSQCLFLLWCMAPVAWNGSQILYNRVVRPFFLKHEATVDSMVNDLSGKAMNAAESVTREGTEKLLAPSPIAFNVHLKVIVHSVEVLAYFQPP